eukprot:7428013-Heterocapsa_arctica.AAC.1
MSDSAQDWAVLWGDPSTAPNSVPLSINYSSEAQNKSNGSENSDLVPTRLTTLAMPAASSSPSGRNLAELLGHEADTFYSAFLSPAEQSDTSAVSIAPKRQTSLTRRPIIHLKKAASPSSRERKLALSGKDPPLPIPRGNSRGRPSVA